VRIWESLVGRPAGENRNLSVNDWAEFFGPSYAPFLTQSWAPNQEQPAFSAGSAYRTNGPIFSLVLARMQVFAQARFAFTRFNGGKPGDLFGTEALSLLERPWRGGTTGDLLARMELDVSLHGTSFVRRLPNRLHVLRPLWCTVIIGSNEDADHPNEAGDAEIAGLIYKPPNAKGVVLLPEQFALYAPIPDPDNMFLGLAWPSTVMRDVQSDDLAVIHKRRFYENAATPNLGIKFDASQSIEQVREFKELLEAEHKGAWNAYKTLYLGGGADPIPLGKDFKEMDFATTQGKGESRLASAAGVPPSWVGFSEGLQGSALNAGNFNAARRRYADGTMHHLWSNAAASLETLVTPPRGAQLWYDTRGMPFMREDAEIAATVQSTEAQTIRALVDAGYTPESVTRAVLESDWSELKHTGNYSVQLQPPGGFEGAEPSAGESNEPAAADADNPGVTKQRGVAETIQKVYLGVGKVITADEAREIANKAGADLAVPGPFQPTDTTDDEGDSDDDA
jgi:hypothetical protein